jgi:hypothetical protein
VVVRAEDLTNISDVRPPEAADTTFGTQGEQILPAVQMVIKSHLAIEELEFRVAALDATAIFTVTDTKGRIVEVNDNSARSAAIRATS